MNFIGRRREDQLNGDLPDDIQIGDYWKILDRGTGLPRIVHHNGKLTEECWYVVVPLNDTGGFAIGNLAHHTVREHEDGTISVLPNDGSSNSIAVSKNNGGRWHGYIYNGEFREA